MAAITAAMVKELREMTDAGMMECKKALVEADGDMDKAVDVLRTRGLAAAAKKVGRATNEGTVMAIVSDDATKGAVVELNCETDFVGMNEKFKGYAEKIARAAMAANVEDVEALKAVDAEGETVEDVLTDAIHTLGENMNLARAAVVEAGGVASYIHGGGKIGVLVTFDVEGIDPASDEFQHCGRDVAMQVAAASPVSATRESVPAEVVAHEMEIYKAQAAESGKPENIQEKIATGRLEKFYKESCLTEQAFVKNPDQSVTDYVNEVAKKLGGTITLKGFVRYGMHHQGDRLQALHARRIDDTLFPGVSMGFRPTLQPNALLVKARSARAFAFYNGWTGMLILHGSASGAAFPCIVIEGVLSWKRKSSFRATGCSRGKSAYPERRTRR